MAKDEKKDTKDKDKDKDKGKEKDKDKEKKDKAKGKEGKGGEEFKEEKGKGIKFGTTFFLLIILALNIIIIAGAIGIITYVKFYTHKEKIKEKEEFTKIIEKDKEETLGPIYTLEEFRVNLGDPGGATILKARIEIEFFDEEALAEAERVTPKIRDVIIGILTAKKKADILNIRGKLFLRDQIMKSINSLLDKGSVKYVYFSKFLIQ
jgi:flagellar protein FliL